jgi:hypothetical protein
MFTSRVRGPAAALALAIAVASGAAAHAASAADSWTEDLTQSHSGDVNLAWTGKALTVKDFRTHPTTSTDNRGYGLDTFPAHQLTTPTDRVTVELTVDRPAGSQTTVDVRGLGADGRWTEWVPAATSGATDLPRRVSAVQSRLTLRDDTHGTSPTVTSLRLGSAASAAWAGASPSPMTANTPAALTYKVYATDEGDVGGTTANMHVIQPNDHFVALPSTSALSPQGSGDYSVQVCGPTRCETAPVWDVGPWNEHDNYWDAQRAEFTDLPQGEPEAQAAYLNGYNGGQSDLSTKVLNPAGIDLADGTFADIGLTDNGYVTVTYLWTGSTTAASHLYGLGPDKNYVAEWDGAAGKWHTIGGPATELYAGDAGLFAISPSDGSINQYTGSGTSWVKIGGPGAQFAEDNGHLYGLGPDKNYVAEWDGSPNKWHTIGGPATAIYAGDAGLFATSPSDGSISRYTGSGSSWVKVGGPGAQFAVGNGHLYGLGPAKNYVAQWDGTPNAWHTIGGPATAIYAGGDGLFATSPSDGSINRYTGSGASWAKVGGPGAQFTVGADALYAIGPNNAYVATWKTSWATIGGPASQIVVGK